MQSMIGRTWKNFLVLLVLLLAACLALPAGAWAVQSGVCGDNLTLTPDEEGTLTISGTGEMADLSSSEEPWSNSPWFDYRSNIHTVVIEPGVTSIGAAAFYRCGSVTSITIPEGVTTIANSAFSLCSGLTSITLPQSVTSIEQGVFYGCTALTDIYYNGTREQAEKITIIDQGNENLTEAVWHYTKPDFDTLSDKLILPAGLTVIGEESFVGTAVQAVVIPNKCGYIGGRAFADSEALLYVVIPENVTDIEADAFDGCPNVTVLGMAGSAAEQFCQTHGIDFETR